MQDVAVLEKPKTVGEVLTSTVKEFRSDPVAFVSVYRMQLMLAIAGVVVWLQATAVGAQVDPDLEVSRPTLELDVDTMLFYIFEGANIIIVALGAVVFLTIGFILGKKILDLIRSAISSL